LKDEKNFRFIEADIADPNLINELGQADYLINEAELPGQAASWANQEKYFHSNLVAVANLITVSQALGIKRFIQASTSSVYGEIACGDESASTKPFSPYGVSKLAAENLLLAHSYNANFNVSILRYFSVFGPRQRPDMAISKFIDSLYHQKPIVIFGDGSQARDITFVDDVANTTIHATETAATGEIYNIAGCLSTTINELLQVCESVVGRSSQVVYKPREIGDQIKTEAITRKARRELNFNPTTSIVSGIEAQYKQFLKDKNNLPN
jgi:nucleoside-diphosphate-sugar epimerase